MSKREVLSILVENQANVLTRIASLYGRRGYNIDSLTVSTTNDPTTSRITIVFDGNEQILNQIILQTRKLEVVKSVSILSPEDSIYRELLLVKVICNKENRSGLVEIVNIYRGKVISLTKEHMIIELTGAPTKIDGFIDMISCYSLQDVCRTGITGISREKNI